MEDGTQNISCIFHDTDKADEVRQTLDMIGDKWSLMAVNLLTGGTKRFSQLKREMTGVSQRMLSRSLRHLQREGLVDRTVIPTNPPTVEYALTAAGESLIVAIIPLLEWAMTNQQRAITARERYDQRITQQGAALVAARR
jgi:DNA-binding HxlR family transcriptional regulator